MQTPKLLSSFDIVIYLIWNYDYNGESCLFIDQKRTNPNYIQWDERTKHQSLREGHLGIIIPQYLT